MLYEGKCFWKLISLVFSFSLLEELLCCVCCCLLSVPNSLFSVYVINDQNMDQMPETRVVQILYYSYTITLVFVQGAIKDQVQGKQKEKLINSVERLSCQSFALYERIYREILKLICLSNSKYIGML